MNNIRFPFTVPDPPGPPRVTEWDGSSATVIWDRPRSDGGARIQGYKVEFRDVADGIWNTADYLVKDCNYQAYNLEPGHTYEFRVRAKNAAGFSAYSRNSTPFAVRGRAGPPSAPRSPRVLRVGRNYVDVAWDAPASDGGSRITGYIIERRELSSSVWVKSNDYNVMDTSFTALNLSEKADFEFRIIAINSAGKSEPSMCTTPVRTGEEVGGTRPEWLKQLPIHVTAPLGRPAVLECVASGNPVPTGRWLRNGREVTLGTRFIAESREGTLRLNITETTDADEGDYTCEASNSLGHITTTTHLKIGNPPRIVRMPGDLHLPEHDNTKLKILYTGDQPVDVVLTKDGHKLSESPHLKYTVFDDYILIFIKDITKDDMGTYKLTIKNSSGEVSDIFSVTVTGLPGPPQGPLEATNITKHTCTLAWKPPTYDGGLPITHYVVERKDISGTTWITIASSVRDTKYTVLGLTEGQEYNFRVHAANDNGIGPGLEGVNPVKAKAPFDAPSAPGIPNILEVGGHFVHLEWAKPENDGGARIQGYWVDKREVGSTSWQRVNAVLCVPNQLNCANLVEGRQYEFRVIAVNEAGNSPPSTNSQQVKAQDPKVATPPEIVKPLKNANCIQNHNAKFTCTITGYPKPTITWYKGAREITNGPRHQIWSEGDNHFLTVMDVFGEDADEYVCRAVNKAGVKSTRAELLIMTAPKLNVPPRFRDTAYFDKGENVVIKIPFTGHPVPKITWMKEGETIESGLHFHVERKERHAILTIRDASKMDSGPYRITAENELGQDSATINIEISGVFTAAYNQQVAVFASLKNWTRKALYNEIDLLTQACYSQIIPGLYLSNVRAAADRDILRRLNITHILTVENRKLPRSTIEDNAISNLFIKASDTSDTNLLRYFPLSNSFIDEGLSKGNVIVHCHFGVSRSATLVIAYLMFKYRLSFEKAYNVVKQRRKFIHPNPGFVRQLKEYERANYRVTGFKKLGAFYNVNARNVKIAISLVAILASVFIPIAFFMTL